MKKRIATALFVLAFSFTATTYAAPAPEKADAAPPANQVAVIYFHRTQRCPTCRKMGSYAEEAIKTGFAQETKTGEVRFRYVDLQNKKNAALTKGYQIDGPALIVIHIENGKVQGYTNLEDIWTKVRSKTEFTAYVQKQVKAYLKKE